MAHALRYSLSILRQAAGDHATVDRVCDLMERQVAPMVRLVDLAKPVDPEALRGLLAAR